MVNEARDDPDDHSQFASRILKTNKDALLKMYDYGNPIDKGDGSTMEHALLIYNRKAATEANSIIPLTTSNEIPLISDPEAATRNCDIMNVLVLKGGTSCTAIVGNAQGVESNHLLQWIRTKPGVKNGPLRSLPLAKAGRGTAAGNGGDRFSPITKTHMAGHQELLTQYLNHLDDVIAELAPIAKRVANANNEIVVMTSNFGQSVLLENFVCNARSKNFDLSNVLVFPTDEETLQLAEGMGLAAFYDERVSLRIVSLHDCNIHSI